MNQTERISIADGKVQRVLAQFVEMNCEWQLAGYALSYTFIDCANDRSIRSRCWINVVDVACWISQGAICLAVDRGSTDRLQQQ